jgi:pimeloyl-ACP methyl ester carboxylesterase
MTIIDIDGVKIYYEVLGQGDPLVMIQGFGHYSLHWGQLPYEFSRNYKVILVDNRGVGRSDKPRTPITIPMMAEDIVRVLDELSIEKANIFGVSMGGIIAQRLAINYSNRVANLILGCTTPSGRHHIMPDSDGQRILYDFDYLKNMTPEQRTMEIFRFFCSEDFIKGHPEAYQYYHRVTLEHPTPTRTFILQADAIQHEDTWDELPQISAHVMIITGTADRIVPYKNSELIRERIPEAELILLEDMRHGFFIEAMDATRIFVDGFLRRHRI